MSQPVFARPVLCALALLVAPLASAQPDPKSLAQAEFDRASQLSPDIENGRRVYLTCAVCHRPEGWGSPDGAYPQIAGQLPEVVIKQLADIRAGNRDNPLMYPFALPRILGGPQNIADVAAYVATLPMTADNARGPGVDLDLGRELYEAQCAECHGAEGEGLLVEGEVVFPPLWGPRSYNWGAGMHRVDTAAAFIAANMPLLDTVRLTPQEAWDVAAYINAHERPQDPRFDGSVERTAARFHTSPFDLYGEPLGDGGAVLGQGTTAD